MKLSIVIPVRGKHNELWFTLQSLCLHQNLDLRPEVELIVADNEPQYPKKKTIAYAQDVVNKLNMGDHARWVAAPEVKSPYFPRDEGARRARGTWLLFLDSHVLLEPGFLDHVLESIEADKYDARTITHFPVTFHYPRRRMGHYDLQSVMGTTFWGLWNNVARHPKYGIYSIGATGIWAYLVRADFYAEIGMFNPGFLGYSGGEPYLDLKAWNLGNGVRLDPAKGGAHWSGPRDYSANYHDRVRNFALAVSVVAPEFLGSLTAHYEKALPTHRHQIADWVAEGYALGDAEAKSFSEARRFRSHTDLVQHWKETGVSF